MPPDSLLPAGAPKSGQVQPHFSYPEPPQCSAASTLQTEIWDQKTVFCFWSLFSIQFSSAARHVQLFATPWTAARQASLSITNSWSLFKLMSIESHLVFIFTYLVVLGLSCMWDLSWGMQNLLVVAWESTCHNRPDQGWNQSSLYWECGVSASGPPGKSPMASEETKDAPKSCLTRVWQLNLTDLLFPYLNQNLSALTLRTSLVCLII